MLRGHIKPALKDGSICKTKSENYRPVMNSSMFLKLFEYSLVPVLKQNLVINPLQFGFTTGSNCDMAITFLKETILSYKKDKSNVHCASIDLSKAFDKVNIKILIDKLSNTSLPTPIINIISHMLTNTYVNVSFNEFIGNEWQVKNGVRQGGIWSSILFNFYINECLDKISSMRQGCQIGYQKANIMCYADDILILAPSASGLQAILDEVGNIMNNLCLKINTQKSVYIMFKNCRKADYRCNVSILGNFLKQVDQISYLGIIITNDMALDKDIERTLNSFLRQFNSMYHKFSFTRSDILYFLFKTYTSSFYGINLWYDNDIKYRNIYCLSVAYHKAVKRVAGMNIWDGNHVACELVGVNLFKHLLAKRLLKHYFAIFKSTCTVINHLRYYFLFDSEIKSNIDNLFRSNYEIQDLLDNDIDAILSRIDYIERNEPRSNYGVV